MASCPPRYKKHVFIDNSSVDFAVWLYQRLLYMGIPAWLREIELYPGCGWSSSVDAAGKVTKHLLLINPLNSINEYTSNPYFTNVSIVSVFDGNLLLFSDTLNTPVFDFRHNVEFTLSNLVHYLRTDEPNYPSIESLDATQRIEEAKKSEDYALKNGVAISSAINGYLRSMLDLENDHLRAYAIYKLGKFRTQPGMIRAALKDPSPRVRQHAVFALARLNNKDFNSLLRIVMLEDPAIEVRLSAQIALLSISDSNLIASVLNDFRANSLIPSLSNSIDIIQSQAVELVDDISQSSLNKSGHIFISYARGDAETFSLNLAKRLREEAGFDVWIDEGIDPGTDVWIHEIEKSIESSSLCVFVVSPKVKDSKWVPREWQYASQCGKLIIPIVYIDTNPMPLFLNTGQGLRPNLSFQDHPDEMFQVLVETLTNKLAGG